MQRELKKKSAGLRYRTRIDYRFDVMKKNDDPKKLAMEKARAKDLRNSQWWKNRIAEGKCYYCDKKFHPSELTMDHALPLSRGGKSVRSNVIPSCKDCNSKKKNLLPSEIILGSLFPDKE